MWSDVVDLRDFYETRLGQVARHLLRRRIRQIWPDLRGETVLGLGYATPLLRQFIVEADRVFALMPAQQGVLHWPPEGPNATALVDETDLPIPDAAIDRVLLVHAVECSEYLRDMLKEVWRVMAGNGRLLVVAPNRRGIWARTDRTPFGSGHPFSPSQLSGSCATMASPQSALNRALYLPPTNSRNAAALRADLGAARESPVPAFRRSGADRGTQADLCRSCCSAEANSARPSGFGDPASGRKTGAAAGELKNLRASLKDIGSGAGGGCSGSGMNSSLSEGGSANRPAAQSALACSMRSIRELTKFHQMWRSAQGAHRRPP